MSSPYFKGRRATNNVELYQRHRLTAAVAFVIVALAGVVFGLTRWGTHNEITLRPVPTVSASGTGDSATPFAFGEMSANPSLIAPTALAGPVFPSDPLASGALPSGPSPFGTLPPGVVAPGASTIPDTGGQPHQDEPGHGLEGSGVAPEDLPQPPQANPEQAEQKPQDSAGRTALPSWSQGSTHGMWYVNAIGGGFVRGDAGTIELGTGAVSSDAPETMGLVTSTRNYSNVVFEADVTTLSQVRTPYPYQWERAVLVWGYQNDSSYYWFVLKDQGWEINKQTPQGLRALARQSGAKSEYDFPVGEKNRVSISQSGGTIRVLVNGRVFATVIDDQPYLTGKVGVSALSASARFGGFNASNG